MKPFLFLFFLACLAVSGCNDSNRGNNIPGEQYSINIERDTTLKTKNGALLEIPKGSIKSETGNTVTLEIKEAYSLPEMVLNGLVTQSNSEPLSSGGMIYINPAQGQKASITKPIRVALPADHLQKDMQLYKGEVSKDGKINWVDPRPLPENKQIKSIDSGQILFQNNCASCHALDRPLTAPALAHFPKRFKDLAFGAEGLSSYWYHNITDWTKSDSTKKYSEHIDTIKQVDRSNKNEVFADDTEYNSLRLYVCNLIRMYGVVGPAFNLSRKELAELYRYIQNESDRKDLPLPAQAELYSSADSCTKYKESIKDLEKQKQIAEQKRENLIIANGELTKETRNPIVSSFAPVTIPPIQPPLIFDEEVSPEDHESIYYQFSIESFGWYNIDVLLKDVNGNQKSELKVRVIGDYHDKLDIFLIIPSAKTYTKAGKTDNGDDEYAFAYKSGKIYLPQNVKAYILGMTEVDSTIAFVLKKFTTTTNQELEISLKRSTPEEYRAAVNSLNSESIHIKVENSKNSQEIKQTDKNLKQIKEEIKEAEKLKPKGCDCDCAFDSDPAMEKVKEADTSKTIKNEDVSINKTIDELSVKTFPNPSNTDFTVKINSNDQNDNINLRVIDISGRLIEVKENQNLNQAIKLGTNYKPGTYLIEVIQGRQQKTIKVIKQ